VEQEMLESPELLGLAQLLVEQDLLEQLVRLT